MGLFGGFKAKFSKESVAKSNTKNSKNKEVVCLGYKVYSEFADPPHYLHQPSSEHTPLPNIKIPPQKSESNSAGSSSAVAHTSLLAKRNKQVSVAINSIPNGLTSNVSSAPSPPNWDGSISTRQNGIITNPKAKQKNGISPKPALRTNNLGEDNAAETCIITNPKAKKSPKKKTAKDDLVPMRETPIGQEDKTRISSSITEVKKSEGCSKSNSYVAEDPTYVQGATSSVNLASNDRLAAGESVAVKTPPKSILKAKSVMEFDEVSKQSSSNTLSVSKSCETITYSATSAVDKNPVNGGYSKNTRGIGNTSSFAANLFFAADDDDDDDDDGVNTGKNRSSADC
ncbi:uncharacterized protein [Euwallacea fornicatus]|uniref:uncharacterized protein n=1 Tax=Euwallacea fornicatus TaxID=995702 RepID=UPI00339069E9